MPVSMVSGALLIASIGIVESFAVAGLGCIITGFTFILMRDLRAPKSHSSSRHQPSGIDTH
ncbi:MAG: hypothetical protein ACYC7D_07290 [Nitrososphaerales archaeon]